MNGKAKIAAKFKAVALALSCMIACGTTIKVMEKPVMANAWKIDFWNYEINCRVIYESVDDYGNYKVFVMSDDGHRIWRNDVEYVPYWYPYGYLYAMLGHYPNATSGVCVVDVRKDALSNESFFAKFSA